MRTWLLTACVWLALQSLLNAADLSSVQLPPPKPGAAKPFMDVVKARQSTRELIPGALSTQMLGDLLWSAYGVNRPETGHRTAPSAMNSQEVDLYVATTNGVYLYEAKTHQLTPITSGDYRRQISRQAFATNAAALLVYVADLNRLTKAKPESRRFYAALDTGSILQNVYLFCASEGLGTVVFELDRPPVFQLLRLREGQEVILTQAVGFTKE